MRQVVRMSQDTCLYTLLLENNGNYAWYQMEW